VIGLLIWKLLLMSLSCGGLCKMSDRIIKIGGEKYVFWPEWKSVMVGLNATTVSEYCFASRSTYAHVHAVAKELASRGLFVTKKDGRSVVYSLTEQGKLLKELLVACDGLVMGGKNNGI